MNEAASVSSLETHLGYWLRAVSNNVSQGFARKLEDEGVTVAEWVFMRMLFDFETVSPSALAEAMGMTRGAISKLADRLIAKDLVERGASLADKRTQTLALKPAGRARVPMLAALADRNDTEFFGVLEVEERGELDRLLRKIVAGRGLAVVTTD
ncbi:MarR family winged helix-turn-helix transcriptional regulator [Rhizobium sp. GN54]|uniref:MarR family winged helix-turn-helix transcriptional regulator n=1 Tax=Rhizobium sp. GN54 TaxID=2898150 RepID=UPI001E4B1BF8|nr:MarR family transcriptional regulator [Rhizobium sp. GN54]MCD2180814.1 MarR family transcriptional regulator [Rhizobium sp. GN54]